MSLKKFNYIFKQAFLGIWRNKVMSLVSIGSVSAVLVILGIVLLIILNVSNFTVITKEKFDEIYVYLEDDLENNEIAEIGNKIRTYDEVLSVSYQSKEYALSQMKKDWGENSDLLDGLENNRLPNSYIIQLKNVENADVVIENLKGFSGIEEVKFYDDVVNKLSSAAHFIQNSGIVIIIILLLISIFIISNTIKITVVSRKKEIELMQYVGASNGFIRGPLVIEGLVLGLIGSLIAIIIVYNIYNYASNYINDKFFIMISSYIVNPKLIINDIMIIFITIGVGIGMLGSLISLKKFLSI